MHRWDGKEATCEVGDRGFESSRTRIYMWKIRVTYDVARGAVLLGVRSVTSWYSFRSDQPVSGGGFPPGISARIPSSGNGLPTVIRND
jgi:hypothetical protein